MLRRWLDTPIISWEYDWMPREWSQKTTFPVAPYGELGHLLRFSKLAKTFTVCCGFAWGMSPMSAGSRVVNSSPQVEVQWFTGLPISWIGLQDGNLWVVVSNIFLFFLFSSRKLGKIPILTHIFQMGWNHQLVLFWADFQLNHFQVSLKINHQPLHWCVMDRGHIFGNSTDSTFLLGNFGGM